MSNFSVLSQHDEQLLRLGMLAEKYFADDPNTSLLKLRQLAESLTQLLAARSGLYVSPEETQYELLRHLLDSSVLPREVYQIFNLRKAWPLSKAFRPINPRMLSSSWSKPPTRPRAGAARPKRRTGQ